MPPYSYSQWALKFHETCHILSRLLLALPYCNPDQRKAILTFSRVQPPLPLEETRYYRRLKAQLHTNVCFSPKANQQLETETLLSLLSPLVPLLDSALAGILATATISAPYVDWDPVEKVKRTTFEKEVEAAESWNPLHFNYSSWFSQQYPRDRASFMLRHDVTSWDITTTREIWSTFRDSKRQLEGMLLYPKIGRKTIGSQGIKDGSRRRLEIINNRCEGLDRIPDAIETIEDVERLYAWFGEEVEGPTEMRSAWRYNDLKPRVYYAQGPSVYHRTKYIQAVFNILVDLFPVVHRHNRFSLPRGSGLPSEILMAIYDYSSFTSRLTESTNFIHALADFYEDTSVFLLDTHSGIVSASLGSLLHEYIAHAQHYPRVDISGLLDEKEIGDIELLYHSCGMLGVPGNISSCTLLHGLYLATVINSLYNCKCVGDDAFLLLDVSVEGQLQWLDTLRQIGILGEVSVEKAETWWHPGYFRLDPEKDGWHYVKRPIWRGAVDICTGDLVVVPSLELILNLQDPYHRRSFQADNETSRLSTLIKQTTRMLTRIDHAEYPLTLAGAQCLVVYLRLLVENCGMIKLVREANPGGIYNPIDRNPVQMIRVGHRELGYMLVDPDVETVQQRLSKSFYTTRKDRTVDFFMPRVPDRESFLLMRPRYGIHGYCPPHPLIGVLKRIGVLDVEEAKVRISLNLDNVNDRALFDHYLDRELDWGAMNEICYRIEYITEPPSWLDDALQFIGSRDPAFNDYFSDTSVDEDEDIDVFNI